MPDLNLTNELELELLLGIVVRASESYMQAMEFESEDIEDIKKYTERYKAFKKIRAYYMNDDEKCIALAWLDFDWGKYECQINCDDPDVLLNRDRRESTIQQELKARSDVLNQMIQRLKRERKFDTLKLVFTFSDEVYANSELRDRIREEMNLVPFDKESIEWYDKGRKPDAITDSPESAEYVLTVGIMA